MPNDIDFGIIYPLILVFDTETTGLDPHNNEIIEFGYQLKKYNGKRYENMYEDSVLVKTDQDLTPKIKEITGIDEKMLKDGVTRKEFQDLLKLLLKENVLLMGYNVNFDMGFLEQELRRAYGDNEYTLDYPAIDVLTITRDMKKFPHKLIDCLKHWEIEYGQLHRALDDTKATYQLFRKLMSKNYMPQAYVNRFGYRYKPRREFKQIKYIHQNFGKKDVLIDYKKELDENMKGNE